MTTDADLALVKFDPAIHDDSAELSSEFIAKMRPSTRGRPKLDTPKVEVKIRLDAATVEHLRAGGPGWQTRINVLLSDAIVAGRI